MLSPSLISKGILMKIIYRTESLLDVILAKNNALPITSVNCSEEDFQSLLHDARSRYFDNDGISLFDDDEDWFSISGTCTNGWEISFHLDASIGNASIMGIKEGTY